MGISGIDGGRIESMLAQLRQSASPTRPTGLGSPLPQKVEPAATPQLDFASALKSQLDSVAKLQSKSEHLEKAFQLGDDKVNLSDVMIAGQKAGIAFQATLQVRNKLVAAYHDVMNMQV